MNYSRRWVLGGTAALSLLTAACGSSAKTATAPAPTPSTASSATTAASPSAAAGVTINTATVAGFGTVLVNGKDGHTLYLLNSEKGGKLTCTDANGCTKIWPDTELPDGTTSATAGNGVQASLLSTVKSPEGKLYPTYNSWPLYEFSGDPGAAQSHGENITSFGGTWHPISVAGAPASTSAASPNGTTASSGSGY